MKLDYIKMKNFFCCNDTIESENMTHRMGKDICKPCI